VQEGIPTLPEVENLVLITGELLGRALITAGLGFVMVQLSEGRPDVHKTSCHHFQTQVHISKRQDVILVKAVHLFENLFAHHHAGGGIGRRVADLQQLPAVTGEVPVKALVAMPSHVTDAQDDPGVLDGVVGEVQLCPNCAHLLAQGVHEHFLQPGRCDHFNIVIQEQQNTSASLLRRPVIHLGIVKKMIPFRDPHPVVGCLQLRVEIKGSFLRTVVFHDEQFEIFVS